MELVVLCLEKFGPLVIGDIGKRLQDMTGIPSTPPSSAPSLMIFLLRSSPSFESSSWIEKGD
jgi:hypothetical protein